MAGTIGPFQGPESQHGGRLNGVRPRWPEQLGDIPSEEGHNRASQWSPA